MCVTVPLFKAQLKNADINDIKAIYKKYQTLADDNAEVFIFHANNERGAESLKAMIQEQFPHINPRIEWVGPVVGLYSGPGCVGMAFRKKEA